MGTELNQLKIDLDVSVFNRAYVPYIKDHSRYLVFYGGAGSGKSVFIAQRSIMKLLVTQKCNMMCIRAVGNTLRDSVFAELKKVIRQWKLEKFFFIREGDMRIICINGNEVLFRGLDDVEKLKSITFANGELTDIWIEEASEIQESDFNQLDVRLRGKGTEKQMVISFNPIDVNHWLKSKFFDNRPRNASVLHTTYKDNKFLDEEYTQLLESYRETDPYYYDVYCRGLWGVYGKTIFNATQVNDMIQRDIKPLKRGFFIEQPQGGYEFNEDPNGDVYIYTDVEKYTPYVIGCDTSGEGSDFETAQVLNNANGVLVATIRTRLDEELFAKQIYALGMYYNKALVAIEANFSTYPIRKLQEWSYPNQFFREVEDKITHKLDQRFGFKTTSVTRPLILSNLISVAREHIDWIVDRNTLFEMLTFVRNEKGRMEAKEGAHDDLIMALAIAHYARSQQSTKIVVPKEDLPPPQIFRRKGKWIVNS